MRAAIVQASLCRSASDPVTVAGHVPKVSTAPLRATSRTACRAEMESENQMP